MKHTEILGHGISTGVKVIGRVTVRFKSKGEEHDLMLVGLSRGRIYTFDPGRGMEWDIDLASLESCEVWLW